MLFRCLQHLCALLKLIFKIVVCLKCSYIKICVLLCVCMYVRTRACVHTLAPWQWLSSNNVHFVIVYLQIWVVTLSIFLDLLFMVFIPSQNGCNPISIGFDFSSLLSPLFIIKSVLCRCHAHGNLQKRFITSYTELHRISDVMSCNELRRISNVLGSPRFPHPHGHDLLKLRPNRF